MYDFHYNYMKKTYGPNAQLLFNDTDSLCYAISTEDVHQDMIKDKHLFDTSEYDPEHPYIVQKIRKSWGK